MPRQQALKILALTLLALVAPSELGLFVFLNQGY